MRRRTERRRGTGDGSATARPATPGVHAHLPLGSELCGYRVTRVLRRDPYSTTYRAHSDHARAGEQPTSPIHDVVDLRVFTSSAATGRASRAIDLHGSVRTAHLQRLIDVGATNDTCAVLVFERTETTLGAVLTARSTISPGEAVTILAPLAQAIAAIHRAGFACGSLTAGHIAFTGDGRPLLFGLDEVERVADGPQGHIGGRSTRVAAIDEPLHDEQRDDWRAFGRIASRLGLGGDVDRAPDTAVAGNETLEAWIETAVEQAGTTFNEQLEYRIFGLADPLPVAFDEPDARHATTVDGPARFGASDVSRRARRTSGRAGRAQTALERVAWLVPSPLLNLLEPVVSFIDGGRGPVRARARNDDAGASRSTVRGSGSSAGQREGAERAIATRATRRGPLKPLVFAAGLAVALVLGGLLLVPDAERGDAAPASTAESPDDEAEDPSDESGPDPRGEEISDAPVDQTSETVLASDDPVAATAVLLEARAACIESRSLACLAEIDEADSAAYRADERAIADELELQDVVAGEQRARASQRLVQRYGDAAIVEVSPDVERHSDAASGSNNEPALVLAVKTSAGWRLRDVFEAV